MPHGYQIVLEGPDASGKKTQSLLLVEALQKEGFPAERVSFPDYDSPFGCLVQEYLEGKTPADNPAFASVLYAADRFFNRDRLTKLLDKGTWIVCDRYVESNIAHQVARIAPSHQKEREQLAAWINHLEYEVLELPKASLTLFLNVSYEVCFAKAAERAKKESRQGVDLHEDDNQHLRLAWERYQEMAEQGGWPVIDCSPEGTLLSREAIAEKIWHTVQDRLIPNR